MSIRIFKLGREKTCRVRVRDPDEDVVLAKHESISGVGTAELAAMLERYLLPWSNARRGISNRPYVCPGCHAVAPERCAPGCIDAEIEEDLRHSHEAGDAEEYREWLASVSGR